MLVAKRTPDKLLIVDDRPTNLRILSDVLAQAGYETRTATDARQAWQAIEDDMPDLVLLDVRMPDVDGYEVCRQIKENPGTHEIPVIFMSALDDLQDKMKGFSAGGVDYVTKPFQVEEMLARIETHLALRSMQRQLAEQNALLEEQIEERRRAEAELQAAQQQLIQQERMAAVGQLAAGLAHDYNNMMASILLYSDILLASPGLGPDERTKIEAIRGEGQRAAHRTQQILDFGRQAILQRQDIDLVPFVENLREQLQRTLPANIRLVVECQAHSLEVRGDPDRLRQAVINLALNARDAMPGGGTLRITLGTGRGEGPCDACGQPADGDWVQLTVSDTGIGISEAIRPHIFEPFFTTRAPLGTGLGLSQVFGIVRQHDGHIRVASRAGAGSSFTLYLPPLAGSGDAAPAGRPLARILLVDDDSLVRQAMTAALEMLGYEVRCAASGQEALALLDEDEQATRIDLVISDLNMPDINGLELAGRIRGRRPGLTVVLTGGQRPASGEAGLRAAGVSGWLSKPADLDELARVVSEALAR